MKKVIATLLFVSIWTTWGFAANRIAYEDFEGVTLGTIPQNNPTGSGTIDRAGRPFYGSAGNGAFIDTGCKSGKCARGYVQSDYIDGEGYTSPKWFFNNRLGGSKEIYLKFDLKVDPNLVGEFTDFKFVTLTDHEEAIDDPPWKWYLQVNPSGGYSVYGWGGSEYYFSNAIVKETPLKLWDSNWHTYEVYIKIGTHITSGSKDDPNNDATVKMWEDGRLILEDHHAPVRTGNDHYELNSVGFIRHVFKGTSKSAYQGNLYFDNLEVWDGMPDENPIPTSNPPGDPTRLRVLGE